MENNWENCFVVPKNSYHLPTVELALKGVLCTRLGSKGSAIRGFTPAPWTDGYAMLMSPNKGETAVHGCHCPGDMVVRMRTVLAIPRGWYVCLSADNYCLLQWIKIIFSVTFMFLAHISILPVALITFRSMLVFPEGLENPEIQDGRLC